MKEPFIKTLSTTLACLVASSVFAIDNPFEFPQPEDEPEPRGTPRPDLVPLDLEVWLEYEDTDTRFFGTKFFVTNRGNADCDDKFVARIGWRVLATDDPVNYPVGYTSYSGQIGASYFRGLQVFDTRMGGDPDSMCIPKEVTALEVYVIVDRPSDEDTYGGGTWLDDFGMDYLGDVQESCETNNVLMGKTFRFRDDASEEAVESPIELPTLQSSGLKVREK